MSQHIGIKQMQEKFTIYLGLNDQITKQQEIQTIDAYKLCVNIVGSCSINEIQGYYKHDDGTTTFEKSFKIEVFEQTEKKIK